MQNGEAIVRLTLEAIRDGSRRWKATAIGYFLCKRPYFHHLKAYVSSIWPALREAYTRLDFARICVMLDISSKLPKCIIVMTTDEDGGESPCKVDGNMSGCPQNVWAVGVWAIRPVSPRVTPLPARKEVVPQQIGVRETPSSNGEAGHEDKGKALVIYNTFDTLQLLDDVDDIPRGPNTSSPRVVTHVEHGCVECVRPEQEGPSASS
ncbi:UNVERIFIED_CONTAM: hypothetical protein Sindi_0073600 [Sesamum indicum]